VPWRASRSSKHLERAEVPYGSFADLVRLRRPNVHRAVAVAEVCQVAVAADRPVVLEAVTDSNVPTLPPGLTPQRCQKLARALDYGDPGTDPVRRLRPLEGYQLR
jgi:pyruvate dehydrogenase (quinone)